MENQYGDKEDVWGGFMTIGRPLDFKTDNSGSMKTLEIFRHSKPSGLVWGDTFDSSICEWLNKDLSESSDGLSSTSPMATRQNFYGGQRLLFGLLEQDTKINRLIFPFRKESYDLIREKLGFPEDFVRSITKKGLRADVHSTRKDDGSILKCFVYKIMLKSSYYLLALSYDRQAGLTYGLLLYTNEYDWPRHIAGLEKRAVYWEHPLLLANLVFKLAIDSYAADIDARDTELNRLEEAMGQHKHKNRPVGDPFDMDYKAVTQSLNFISRTLGLVGMRLSATQLAIEKILKHTKGMGLAPPQTPQFASEPSSVSDNLEAMEEHVGNLVDCCKIQLIRVEYQEKRAKTQSTAVYSFVTQKDAKVIKTISVLGMLFLPGTFIAAIFAMPLFNWNGQDGPSINALGLKYYCAVTIPFTIMVFMLWAIWPRLSKWVTQPRPPQLEKTGGIEREV